MEDLSGRQGRRVHDIVREVWGIRAGAYRSCLEVYCNSNYYHAVRLLAADTYVCDVGITNLLECELNPVSELIAH